MSKDMPIYATIAALDGLVTVYRKIQHKDGYSSEARTETINAYADSLPALKDCPYPVFDFRADSVDFPAVLSVPNSARPSSWASYCGGTLESLTEYYTRAGVPLYNRK